MAHEDRERMFEKALERNFPPGRPGDAKANSVRNSEPRQDACPDAEILASYHERLLGPAELAYWKSHITGCARCQEILSQLELTDEIPLGAGRGLENVAEPESLVAAAHRELRSAADSRRVEPSVREIKTATVPPAGRLRWRWIAPAGAIAASLFVWVALQENKSGLSSPQQSIPTTKEERAAVPESSVSTASGQRRDELQEKSGALAGKQLKKDVPAAPSAMMDLPLKGRDLELQEQLAPKRQAGIGGQPGTSQGANGILSTYGDARARAEGAVQANGNLQSGGQQNANVHVAEPKMEAQAAPAALPPEQNYQANNAAPPPAVVPQAIQNVELSPEALQDQVRRTSDDRSFADRQLMKAASKDKAAGARLVSSPAGKVIWRVGPGGFIEQSLDAGRSFERQDSGVKTELFAASASSDSVCWVVGRSGTVLRTLDGGAHWSKVASPTKQNLGAVRAVDDLHATVWGMADREGFETSDGGATWRPVGNQ
jgi:hypothetical protein